MNKVVLIGRITADPIIRYSQGQNGNNTAIARYTLAVDRKFKKEGDQQTADFISCVAFGKLGEHAEKYYNKGLKVAVEGHIQTGSYTNQQGVKVYTTDVIVDACEFVESKANSEQKPQQTTPSNVGDGFINVDNLSDEGLPF